MVEWVRGELYRVAGLSEDSEAAPPMNKSHNGAWKKMYDIDTELRISNGLQTPSDGVYLHEIWRQTLREAIIRGNLIHDDIFDTDAVNIAVEEAIEIASEECFVDKVERQYDIFGTNVSQQLCDIFNDLATVGRPSYNVIVAIDMKWKILQQWKKIQGMKQSLRINGYVTMAVGVPPKTGKMKSFGQSS
ncbi:hypothetical protein QZH41_002249 [Actinostola sp. cb2023]|nr:hypothetical protein QZH41_002249 [Actinostola sp. cb2023]